MTRVALFSDAVVAELAVFDTAQRSLRAAGVDVVAYTEVQIEPTDESFKQAAAFASQAEPDGYVSVGGGSVIDTAKAANLYASYPADFLEYVNAPVGSGTPVPGPLKPHIACPTTSGTGSEVTGMAIFDLLSMAAKTGIASPALRPTEALVDPDCTDTLPAQVVACSGARRAVARIGIVHCAALCPPSRADPAGSSADEPGRQPVERPRESGSHAVARPVFGASCQRRLRSRGA